MGVSDHHEHLHAEAPRALAGAALEQLRERGERVTPARRAVVDVLARHHDHLSADRIAADVAELGIHRATVYRTLDLLTAFGIVTTHPLPQGSTGYHLAAGEERHAHLHGLCRTCGTVVALPADLLSAAAQQASRATGFELDPLQSSLVGTCAACRTGIR